MKALRLTRPGMVAGLTFFVFMALSGCASNAAVQPQPEPQPETKGVAIAEPVTGSSEPSSSESSSSRLSSSESSADVRARFQRWVADFRAGAAARGVGRDTLALAFDDIELVRRIIELDRSQPEFTRRVWSYLDSAVSERRVFLGRQQLATYADIARAVERRYGVPRTIIGAIWGVESNYGRNFGSYDTVEALATLAFDGRRREFAVEQLYAVLDIIESGAIERERLRGSWAGAMGHTQFLPTSYRAYAVDGNGDGRIDIWNSIADVMASTANYLVQNGWQRGSRWGVEAVLPPGFDYGQATLSVTRPARAWVHQGVHSVSGSPLPDYAQASIIAPAGARGPAFLVGPNFRVIMDYNNSISYALAVGLLSNQLAGRPGVQASWPRALEPLSRTEVMAMQRLLNRGGYSTGGRPDGIVGPNTQAGIREFQRAHDLIADGFATQALLRRVRHEVSSQ